MIEFIFLCIAFVYTDCAEHDVQTRASWRMTDAEGGEESERDEAEILYLQKAEATCMKAIRDNKNPCFQIQLKGLICDYALDTVCVVREMTRKLGEQMCRDKIAAMGEPCKFLRSYDVDTKICDIAYDRFCLIEQNADKLIDHLFTYWDNFGNGAHHPTPKEK